MVSAMLAQITAVGLGQAEHKGRKLAGKKVYIVAARKQKCPEGNLEEDVGPKNLFQIAPCSSFYHPLKSTFNYTPSVD